MATARPWLRAGLCGLACLAQIHCAGLRGGAARAPVSQADSGAWLDAPARRLTDSSADQAAPSFSGDGSRIIYQSNGDGNWELYQMTLADGRPQRLTDTPEAEEDPSWSPDSRWILCTVHVPSLDADPPRDILLISADGRTRRTIAAHGGDDWSPRFTPDGKAVLFMSDRVDERRDLGDAERQTALFRFSMEDESLVQVGEGGRSSSPVPADSAVGLRRDDHHLVWLGAGGMREAVTDSERVMGHPDWQAAAGWVVCELSPDRDGRLLVRSPGRSDWRELPLEGREADQAPAWAGDGRQLVFAGRSQGQWDLFLRAMPAAGAAP